MGEWALQIFQRLAGILPAWIHVTAVADGSRDQVDVGVSLVLPGRLHEWSQSLLPHPAAAALGLLLQLKAALRSSSHQALNELIVFSSVHVLESAQALRASCAPGHGTVECTLERIDGGEVGPDGVESLILVLVLAGGVREQLLPLGKRLEEDLALHLSGLGDGVQALQVPDGELR